MRSVYLLTFVPVPRKLSDRELRKIERWARSNKKSELVDFFSELPRRITIPKATLLGSINGSDFRVQGYTVTSAIIDELFGLDDRYIDQPLGLVRTKQFDKRHERIHKEFWPAMNRGMRHAPSKVCMAAHLGDCSSQIIAAHTIQKSELGSLARSDGHVYGFLFGGKSDHRNFHLPEPVGIKVATTFTGVCSHHDNQLFKPIETRPFDASKEQMFLFHYRSILFEHYRRAKLYEKLQVLYDDLGSKGHAEMFDDLKDILDANKLDTLEVASEARLANAIMQSRDFASATLACWISNSPPPIAGTIALGSWRDFLGNRLPRPADRKLDWVTVTITPKDGRTLVVIGANSKSATSTALIRSLDAIHPEKRMQTLIGYCLCCMEDLLLIPQFWESLNKDQKEGVVRTYKARIFPRKMPSLGKWTMIRKV